MDWDKLRVFHTVGLSKSLTKAGESLTPLRRRVLELLIDQPGPAKAYDLLPLLEGIANLAASSDPVPHMPSIEEWRKGDRKTKYNPNDLASRQEMRSMACGQCHVAHPET